MATDPHHSQRLSAVVLEDPNPEPREPTAEEKLADLEQRVLMRDSLLAIEVKHLHTIAVKLQSGQERHHERSRALLVEIRDSMRELAKPDPTQDAILAEMRALRALMKDAVEAMQNLIAIKNNGHAN